MRNARWSVLRAIRSPWWGRCLVFTVASFAALATIILGASQARANDGFLTFLNSPQVDALTTAMFWAYNPVVWVIEALVLDRFFRVGFWKCLGMATVANLVSTAISAFWYFGGDGMREGWKTAWIFGHKEAVVMLFIHSFLITVAEETLVVLLFMRKRISALDGLKAVTVAHIVTYGLTALMVAYLITTIKPQGG